MAKKSNQHAGTPELIALGGALRHARKQVGLSQEALALSADIDRSYLGGIERGENNVALMNILRLSRALGITAAELLQLAEL